MKINWFPVATKRIEFGGYKIKFKSGMTDKAMQYTDSPFGQQAHEDIIREILKIKEFFPEGAVSFFKHSKIPIGILYGLVASPTDNSNLVTMKIICCELKEKDLIIEQEFKGFEQQQLS